MFRSPKIFHLPKFSRYLEKIGNNFCPFVTPADEESLLLFSEYDLEKKQTMKDRQKMIFYAGILHTELLRKDRKRQKTTRAHDLLCENLIFHLNLGMEIDGRELFSWPHWYLKVIYTRTSILYGKFWKNEKLVSKSGLEIPPPPNHFLSIRSAVKPTDKRFFLVAPQLTEDYLSSCDAGERVLGSFLGKKIPPIIEYVQEEDLGNITEDTALGILEEMNKTFFYEEIEVLKDVQLKK